MAGGTQYEGYTISGITGGYPVCTKLELINDKIYTRIMDTQTISDNNPNISVDKWLTVGSNDWGVRLYDADGNLIVEKWI